MRKKLLAGTTILLLAEGIGNICIFARNVILARYLTKSDFGVAAALGVVLSMVELNGKMAFGQQVVQHEQGDSKAVLGTFHSLQVALGIVSSVILLSAAGAFTEWLVPGAQTSMVRLLVIGVLAQSFINLRVSRLTTSMNFRPQAFSEAGPEAIATLCAWPLVVYFQDVRVFVWLAVLKMVATSCVSNLVSDRRFELAFDRSIARASIAFCLPFCLSTLLLMAVSSGDRLVVALHFPSAALGEFAVAASLTAVPTIALLKISTRIGLPLLVEARDSTAAFRQRYASLAVVLAFISTVFTLGMILTGETLIRGLYGAKYTGVGTLAAILTGAQALRIVRNAVLIAAMAKGETKSMMLANLVRFASIILVLPALWWKPSILTVAVGALVGETLATFTCGVRAARLHGLPLWLSVGPPCMAGIGILPVTGMNIASAQVGSPILSVSLGFVGCCVAVVALWAGFPDARTPFSLRGRSAHSPA